MTVAVLALQGAFIEHRKKIEALGERCIEIRQKKDLDESFDRLILPGGESTTQKKLLHELGLFEPLKERIEDGLPTLGTCAGLILLAERVQEDTSCFGTIPITVKRNAYGRQLGSFFTTDSFKTWKSVPMTFIRAPYIAEASPECEILATVNNRIVAVQYGKQIGISFHPELNEDNRIHELFLSL